MRMVAGVSEKNAVVCIQQNSVYGLFGAVMSQVEGRVQQLGLWTPQ